MKTFKTWHYAGTQFLSFPFDIGSDTIVDENGNNYGSWVSVDEFRKRQQAGDPQEWLPLGTIRLSLQHITPAL